MAEMAQSRNDASAPEDDSPELSHEEWGNGDVIISDAEGRWIQADSSVFVSQGDWR